MFPQRVIMRYFANIIEIYDYVDTEYERSNLAKMERREAKSFAMTGGVREGWERR